MKRREFLKLSLAGAAGAALSSRLRAQELPRVIRIGTQKGGFFPAVRQRHTIEDTLKPSGIDVQWVASRRRPIASRALALIPRPVKVADIVWKWTPAS